MYTSPQLAIYVQTAPSIRAKMCPTYVDILALPPYTTYHTDTSCTTAISSTRACDQLWDIWSVHKQVQTYILMALNGYTAQHSRNTTGSSRRQISLHRHRNTSCTIYSPHILQPPIVPPTAYVCVYYICVSLLIRWHAGLSRNANPVWLYPRFGVIGCKQYGRAYPHELLVNLRVRDTRLG